MPFSSHHFDFLRMKSFRKPTIKVSTCNIKCIQGKLSKDWKLARMGVRPGNCTIITAVCPIVTIELSSLTFPQKSTVCAYQRVRLHSTCWLRYSLRWRQWCCQCRCCLCSWWGRECLKLRNRRCDGWWQFRRRGPDFFFRNSVLRPTFLLAAEGLFLFTALAARVASSSWCPKRMRKWRTCFVLPDVLPGFCILKLCQFITLLSIYHIFPSCYFSDIIYIIIIL